MKHLLLIVPVLLVVMSVDVQAQSSVEVEITNIKKEGGELRVALFDEQNFENEKEIVAGKIVKAEKGSMTILIDKVKPGTYALKVLHDENGNGKLDLSKLGIPKEGFAFGNNAMGKKAPPSFDKAKVIVGDGQVKQTIKMKYF